MGIVDRLRLALESDFGTLLFGLCGALSLLGMAYFFMLRRQKRRDLLAYKHSSYYQAAEAVLKGFEAVGGHKADFFGRETIGTLTDGRYGLCRIPGPGLFSDEMIERFQTFHRVVVAHKMAVFAPYLAVNTEPTLMTVQGRIVRKDGRLMVNAREYLEDGALGGAEVEEVLLELARALAALHRLKTDYGAQLYHGFLLPRSIFLDLDSAKRLRNVIVADLGVAFAMGPEKLAEQLEQLRHGKLTIEKFCGQELLEQLPLLAPEQKDAQRLHLVGPAADFYSYAAFAVSLFTKKRISSAATIHWDLIPSRWKAFLKSCLQEDPEQRPKDFMELMDWLQNPELGLTHREVELAEETAEELPPEIKQVTLDELGGMLEAAKKQKENSDEISPDEKLPELLQRVDKAFAQSKWSLAKKALKRAQQLDPEHPRVDLGWAILAYEAGEMEEAEKHYQKAKEKDGQVAKRFRQHIAFRI